VFTGARSRTVKYRRSTAIQTSTEPVTWTQTSPAGISASWTDAALAHFAAFFGVSILLLMPYWLLRAATRPLQGLNGY